MIMAKNIFYFVDNEVNINFIFHIRKISFHQIKKNIYLKIVHKITELCNGTKHDVL